jgi:GTP-binding protein YchF
VSGKVDPVGDAEIVNTELMLADLESVIRRMDPLERSARAGANKEAEEELALWKKVRGALDAGKPVRSLEFSKEEGVILRVLQLITAKKMMYVANVGEEDGKDPGANRHVQQLVEYAKKEGVPVVPICAKLEAEIAELDEAEKTHFLADYGMPEPGLDRVIRAGYELLELQTYFTAGEKEVRAWTIRRGMKASQAAGVIHSDFERGFIRAEVYHCGDLSQHGSEKAVKEAGLARLEGRDYVVQDGDVVFFRFAV